ncbi:substrate-binding domain-containing protein [Microbacterium aquimaris]|uniref:substrate-binding domain-containing protein n=1 Tax=Microbacterium aquimaris TaxID=459816 RepID=UPI002AD554A0|nr:substrate-binding domain-containing protein [Microbacterium aquimaris]MDZ8275355.1 substrate-binding domain-containing protein [Microbacterium aquimaris]
MINLFSGLVVKQPLVESIIPDFEAESGEEVACTFEPTQALLERIAQGSVPDLLIGTASALDDLVATGVMESAVTIAVSTIGFARRPGSPGPADDEQSSFLDYLRSARSVAYSLSGASGLHFMRVMESHGALGEIDTRATRLPTGLTAEALFDGRADVAIQQMSELRAVSGDHIVRPIPHALQSYAAFAVGSRPGAPAAAKRLQAALTEEAAQRAFTAVGLAAP